MTDEPYNPLDKLNLAKSIEAELLARRVDRLSSTQHITGAGVYAIYYTGRSFKPYGPISRANRTDYVTPIYVGKAIPKGGRKGGVTKDASTGRALANRMRQHAASINQTTNLRIEDFSVRHLVVDDIWIPLGENILIETFKPVWNQAIDGFGNNTPGKGRERQAKSMWDMLHPGRKAFLVLPDSPLSVDFLQKRVKDFLAGRPMDQLPKRVQEQLDQAEAEAEEEADDVPL
jgi:hypothetical protein